MVESKLLALSKTKFVNILVAAGLLIYGFVLVKFAVYAVGGTDSSGYIRIARSLLHGDLVQRAAELDLLGLPDEFLRNLFRVGFTPGGGRDRMTQVYQVVLRFFLAIGRLCGGWDLGLYVYY